MDDTANAPEEAAEVEATAPPAMDEKTGVAMSGDYPFNHRLRAEALAKAGKDEDPDGLVSPELIADAGERVERERVAEEKAHPPVSADMPRANLDRIARKEGLDPATYANRVDLVAAIEERRAAPPSGSPTEVPPPPQASTSASTETQES